MKSKNSRIYLLICTLALCIGLASFGVYAALSASLNISGTLGFNMHNAMVEISGEVKNIAQADDDANYIKTSKNIQNVVMGSTSGISQGELKLGNLYFYKGLDEVSGTGKVLDIVFELTITNIDLSNRIVLEIPSPTLPTNVVVAEEDYYTYLPYKSYFDAGQSKTLKFAFRLTDESSLSSAVNFDLDMSFTGTVVTTPSYFTYEENFGWYVAMGTNPYSGYNEPLKWIPFATNGATTTVNSSAPVMSAYNNKTTEPTTNYTYYFLSQYLLDPDSSSAGMPYNYYGSDTTNCTSSYYNGTEWVNVSGINSNDYAASNIRAYLTGHRTAYRATDWNTNTGINEANPFMSQFGISTSDTVYKKITNRSNTSLYSDIATASDTSTKSSKTASTVTMTINGTSANVTASTGNKFWLPSYYEMYNYWGGGQYSTSNSELIFVANTLKGKSAGLWWLRSPYADDGYDAWCVLDYGGVSFVSVSDASGVRPAFQLRATV